MRTVYAVSQGDYSDYHVHVICETREIAERICAKINAESTYAASYAADVEEMTLVESADDIFRIRYYIVFIDMTSGAEVSRRHSTEVWNYEFDHAFHVTAITPDKCVRGVSDRSYDVALKAARDLLAKHKAANAGIAS